jgi:hypothetical protein
MAFALNLRLHSWHPISTAPCNRGVELRVCEGMSVSTLEFPCRQTNAGDWINCDLSTPIKIRPVEWRAWRHGHSPQPPSPQVNAKRRLAVPRRGPQAAKRSPAAEMKPLDRSVRLRKNLATMAYVLIGIVITATVVGSLTRISAWALPIGFTESTPPSTLTVSIATMSRPRTADSCKDFGSAFLNSACSTRHKRYVARGSHRVATLMIGRQDAPP